MLPLWSSNRAGLCSLNENNGVAALLAMGASTSGSSGPLASDRYGRVYFNEEKLSKCVLTQTLTLVLLLLR